MSLLEEFDLDQFKRNRIGKDIQSLVRTIVTYREREIVNPDFVEKHGLDLKSLLSECFVSWIPIELTSRWTAYTNTQAMVANTVQEGNAYPDYKLFLGKELQQHIAVFMLQGITPIPQVSK